MPKGQKDKIVNITFQLKGEAAEHFEEVKGEQFTFIDSDATIAKKLMLERLYQIKAKPEAETVGAP